jgi:hypothetical protein
MIGPILAWSVIILSAGACIGYLIAGDYRRACYWGAAVVLNISAVMVK